MSIFCTQR